GMRHGPTEFPTRAPVENDDEATFRRMPRAEPSASVISPLLERALHDDRVQPAVELESNVLQRADMNEAASSVQSDRGLIGGVSDDGDDLVIAFLATDAKHVFGQGTTNAPADAVGGHVDRILERVSIGPPRTIPADVAVTEHSAGALR